MKLKIHQCGQGWEVRNESGEVLFANPLQSLCATYVLERTAGKPLDCPAEDTWNCKYCRLVEKCKLHSAEYDVRTLPLSTGYVALVEEGDSEFTRVIGLHPAHGAPYGKPTGEEDATIKKFLDEMLERYKVNDPLMYRAWTGRRPGEPERTPGPLDAGVEEYFKTIHAIQPTDQFFAEMLEEMYRVNAMFETTHPTDSYAELLRPARIDLQLPVVITDPQAQKSREEILADITAAIETIHAETSATPPLSLRQQIAAQLAINAQRYGTITATTDWDTPEGAIRLRFMKYCSCQIAVRMHNGELTHLWLDGDLFYDAH